jgi:hypothetical protein
MLNLSGKTSLSSEEIMQKAKDFFGQKGLKLELTEEEPDCLTFTGGGGYVTATICPEEGKNRVEIITQEWEYHVKEFMASL